MRLATFNLLNGTSLHDGQVDRTHLEESIALLRPDVVGLQEVDRGQPRSHGADLTAQVADSLHSKHFRFVPALIGTPSSCTMHVIIRKAVESDVGPLVALSRRTIGACYRPFLGQEAVDAFLDSGAADRFVEEGISRCWVVLHEGAIAGYGSAPETLWTS